jgi:hypothetical protein
MAQKKHIPTEIITMARDLKLGSKTDPFSAIIKFCEKQIQQIIAEMDGCDSLSDLLDWVGQKVGTIFREIHSDKDLQDIKNEYCIRNEKVFANLENELFGEVYGVTYRLLNPEEFENHHVSLIDCRGTKSAKSYFTKWHEIAHLLTLTDQNRLVFRRTHSSISGADPEERLMDSIAGRIGFYDVIFHKHIKSEISFNEIERLRSHLCPEASQQASLINFVKYWSSPCIHLTVGMGLNKTQEVGLNQGTFDFVSPPEEVLRALRAKSNQEAKKSNFQLFDNMRVPENSVIYNVFQNNLEYAEAEANENLGWWNGQQAFPVKVKVRKLADLIDVLIIPS